MRSALKLDNDLLKEFKISESSDLDPLFKMGYVRNQIDEFKKVMFRNRVDAIISQDLVERSEQDGNTDMANEGRKNLASYRNVIKQMNGAIEVMEQLKNELEPLVESSQPEK